MDEDVFVLSDMTVELHHLPDGDLIGFNGTTEWALDAVEPDDALWLPGESQLRELLGGSFVRLERREDRWHVLLRVSDEEHEVSDPDDRRGLRIGTGLFDHRGRFQPGCVA